VNAAPKCREDWELAGREDATDKQLRMLKAVCGCLAKQIDWHGGRLSPDAWRWFLSGCAMGFRAVPGYNNGDGQNVVVMLGRSSKELNKTTASKAINIGLDIGDQPWEQGLKSDRVQWSPAVLLGLGFNPKDLEG
jgi:hypothetical protein